MSTASDVLALTVGVALDVAGTRVERSVERDLAAQPRTTLVPDAGAAARASHLADVDLPADALLDASLARREGATTASTASVASPTPPAPVAITVRTGAVAGAILGALAALAWAWPHAKKLALVALYSHIGRSEALESPVRERIFLSIKAEPGVTATELARRAGVSWGTAMYHLEVLGQCGMVVAHKDGRYRRYFANGAPADKESTSVLRNARTSHVRDLVAARPGLTQRELSDAVGLSPQALHWHLVRLERAGLVTRVREGRTVRHFLPSS